MRARTLTLRAATVGALLLTGFAAPAYAGPEQGYACPFKVTSLNWTPNTYDNGPAPNGEVTVKATPGFTRLELRMPETAGTGASFLKPVLTQPGTYKGTSVFSPSATPGSYLPEWIFAEGPCLTVTGVKQNGYFGPEQIAAANLQKLTVTQPPAPADLEAPKLVAFTGSSGTFDATRGGSIPVTVRATDDRAVGAVYVNAVDGGDSDIPTDGINYTGVQLTLTSGTRQDGVWTGNLPIYAGSQQSWAYKVTMGDSGGHTVLLDPPPPAPTGFRTFTTAAPPKPTGISAVTTFVSGRPAYAIVSWNASPANQPGAAYWYVTTSGSCGAVKDQATSARSIRIRRVTTNSGLCTVTVKAHNVAGTSAAATATALL